jgi:hypothetical protein
VLVPPAYAASVSLSVVKAAAGSLLEIRFDAFASNASSGEPRTVFAQVYADGQIVSPELIATLHYYTGSTNGPVHMGYAVEAAGVPAGARTVEVHMKASTGSAVYLNYLAVVVDEIAP